jgi:hypothetical protein
LDHSLSIHDHCSQFGGFVIDGGGIERFRRFSVESIGNFFGDQPEITGTVATRRVVNNNNPRTQTGMTGFSPDRSTQID